MKCLIAAACILGLGSMQALEAEDRIRVVATLPDFARIAEAVGGERVQAESIASGLQDPHFVDPKPSHVLKLRDADLLLVNGMDLEVGWLPPLLESARNPRINIGSAGYIDCSRGISALEVPAGGTTRAEGDVHALGNPHYMTDPLNGRTVAQTVCEALKGVSPENAAYFEERRKSFLRTLDEAMFGRDLVDLVGGGELERLCRDGGLEEFLRSTAADGGPSIEGRLGGWMGKMRRLHGRKIVFHHRSYSYFLERFGLRPEDYVELKPGITPGPGHLADLVERIRSGQVPVVATHPFHDERLAAMVAEKGGARMVVLPLGVGGAKGTDDYVSFFDAVTDLLVRAYGE
ncbi:MAG: zinc ABC transporter substrate-binding protein [Planctomycetes bacterium]|nr:zinc ABC transporter substrate-binding protein [Planctomycetota bacterium]